MKVSVLGQNAQFKRTSEAASRAELLFIAATLPPHYTDLTDALSHACNKESLASLQRTNFPRKKMCHEQICGTGSCPNQKCALYFERWWALRLLVLRRQSGNMLCWDYVRIVFPDSLLTSSANHSQTVSTLLDHDLIKALTRCNNRHTPPTFSSIHPPVPKGFRQTPTLN